MDIKTARFLISSNLKAPVRRLQSCPSSSICPPIYLQWPTVGPCCFLRLPMFLPFQIPIGQLYSSAVCIWKEPTCIRSQAIHYRFFLMSLDLLLGSKTTALRYACSAADRSLPD